MKSGFRLLLVSLSLISCAKSGQSDHGKAALIDATHALDRAVATRDLDQITSFYADDARMIDRDDSEVEGKQAIRSKWQQALANNAVTPSQAPKRVDVSSSGDMGYTIGNDTTPVNSAPEKAGDEWLSIWKRQSDKKWQIVQDAHGAHFPPTPGLAAGTQVSR